MKLNYIDLGMHRGDELDWMLNNVTPYLDISYNDCRFYGFDAQKQWCDYSRNRIIDDRVKIYHKAISLKEGQIELYYTPNNIGSSIYKTKTDVADYGYRHEMVDAIKFSDWMIDTIPTYKDDVNVVKINIEGAEWDFFKDIIDTDMLKDINIICGQGYDVDKVSELDSDAFHKLIDDNNIDIVRFTERRITTHKHLTMVNNMTKLINKEVKKN